MYNYDQVKSSYCSFVVVTNENPYYGSLAVTPDKGISFTDDFTFLAQNWYDTDLPLTYQFSFSTINGIDLAIQSRSENLTVTSQLPPGLPYNNYTLSTKVEVYDYFLAASAQSVDVIVAPSSSLSSIEIANNLLLSEKVSLGLASYEVIQLVSLISSALNYVNCESSPDCKSMNREYCQNTKNTCGPCMSDFIGRR